jgi:hypothetical protein
VAVTFEELARSHGVTYGDIVTELIELRARVAELEAQAARRGVTSDDAAAIRRDLARSVEEPPTKPQTPEARRRSSDKLAAVRLPDPGLDTRVAKELEAGKEPKT